MGNFKVAIWNISVLVKLATPIATGGNGKGGLILKVIEFWEQQKML